MKLASITAISPIDGRYSSKTNILKTIFSEFGLLKFRVKVEIRWLQMLSECKKIREVPIFNKSINNFLENIFKNFSRKDAIKIKYIENIINHDVKAVEYFLKEIISNTKGLSSISEFIHFACTSEDINNLSYALMLKTARNKIIIPTWTKIVEAIKELSIKYRNIPMLCRTHGQPASPSTMGKEMFNVVYRLQKQLNILSNIKILGKFNGAVGNYNAHFSAYPKVNWQYLSKKFVTSFGISWNPYTTQIEPHDYISELLDCIMRFNVILIDFNRDIWGYITLNYFKQKPDKNSVGSSTMPHKINPINFENSEANLGLANAIMRHMSSNLPLSRWQRDLTDSTILRNLGVGIGYSLIAYKSTLEGLSKLDINYKNIIEELNKHWEVLAEPIQTVMRRHGIKNAYEKLRELTKGKNIDSNTIKEFINSLLLPKHVKKYLSYLSPSDYLGIAKKFSINS